MKKTFFCLVSIFLLLTNATAQTNIPSDTIVSATLSGTILDEKNEHPLPYANIINLNNGKGTISNEHGNFTIDIANLKMNDTIRFQCIGYKTKELTIERIANTTPILLSENIYTLDEVLNLGTFPNPVEIVKGILENRELNYKNTPHKKQVFIRERSTTDILNFKLNFKKSNISELNPEMIQKIEEKTPKHSQSYSDLLTNIYIQEEANLKLVPIKTVALKSEDITELDNFMPLIESVFKNTTEEEYWRVKTGILGIKVNFIAPDSTKKEKLRPYKNSIKDYLGFTTFNDEDQWEFLHKTKKYNFKIIGGTSIDNESVYIIDFTPKKKGVYEGRLYISVETSALIRADYKYSPDKLGTNIQILGIGYKQTNFTGSIYFEKKEHNYQLKYLSYQNNYKVSIDRKIALQKKKKRFLINKKLQEIKVGLDFTQENNESIELLVIDQFPISEQSFDKFEEGKYMDITYVNQFNENLWKGYTTITPTKQMKEYKKLEK
ncbi:MAG: carboxypeptidase-like regulatory domain-containing protein [Flavobacteriales bacterium]|nr:carboxypeptidase-like regulatory domain-containing protein [Flavobacteriales bacterium]